MRREIVITPRPVRKVALWTPWGVMPRDEGESLRAEEKPGRRPTRRPRPAAKDATPARRRTFEPLA
ncbi:MAG TPA: hypothetical protein PL183_06030 [Aquamicrobium sp.]|nr:hypothetical protein [Aquamicrobium sp.]